MKWVFIVIAGSIATVGCSSLVVKAPTAGYASLAFAEVDSSNRDFIPGTFQSVNGVDIPTTSEPIYVKAGWRRVGYTCPNHLTFDGPPIVAAVFEAGASYQLRCIKSEAVIQRVGEG